jgi:hypothetical protein
MSADPTEPRRPHGNTIAWCVLVGSLLATVGLQWARAQIAQRY